ncbi:MAG: dissimilatory sulfite reductase D family protein [Thermoanaerobacteraceae bacterium]|uniref:Sulfite reductase n=1 Tax=Desulfofundulus thermobenzoicus TaxID=29376 RepID=A0A6N7IRE7_9FIRM|nr:dissimilatory sulfite reductase D family protein [Desulfofundulus thermobenzoicus]MBE3587335.1 dissimilatory sulfite reductase D family protein [Thermoanaerobacteraceae bacterium]MQL52666.1 sulfite reductase [Desulfofundulus thermobenzoicus]HHW44251.1 sulfite reductase [Desulfotomaculum sp.]
MDEIKKVIVEFAESSKKTKFYFKDMEKAVQEKIPGAKARDIKKAASELINEGTLIYFSTGSTTMYGLKGRGITEDK